MNDDELDRLNANRGCWFEGADRAPDGTIVQRFRAQGKPGAMTRYVAIGTTRNSERVTVTVIRAGCRLLTEIANAKWQTTHPSGDAA